MPLLNKENLVKLVALVIVIAFLLEIFAFQRGSGAFVDNTQQTQPEQKADLLFGVAFANATIVSYEGALGPSITIEGNASSLNEIIRELKAQKLITYTTPIKNGIILNLVRDANISAVVEALSPLNLTLTSQAELFFNAPVVFNTSKGTLNISLQNIKAKIDPSIPKGYTIGVKILANIRDGVLIESQYTIIPVQMTFLTMGETVALSNEYSAIGVLEWPNRHFDENITVNYLSQRFENVRLFKIINETVSFSKPMSVDGYTNLTAMNLSYIKAVNSNFLSVSENFTDKGKLEADLKPVLDSENITLYYPYSYVRIDFSTENYSRDFLDFSLNATFFIYRNSTVRIGQKIYDESEKIYQVLNREYVDFISYRNQTGDMFPVEITANVIGNKILNYTMVQ